MQNWTQEDLDAYNVRQKKAGSFNGRTPDFDSGNLRSNRKPVTKNKYHNKKVIIDGIKFDSIKEGNRYQTLKTLERQKAIKHLEIKPVYSLVVNNIKIGKYIPDFRYYINPELVVEDVKGIKTPVYNLKKKLMKALFDIDILET